MAASDHLSGAQFFHGTDHEFSPGDPLLPPAHTGIESKWSASRDDRVYMSTDSGEAAKYGKNVYAVRPKGRTEKGFYFPEHERLAPMATVLGRV